MRDEVFVRFETTSRSLALRAERRCSSTLLDVRQLAHCGATVEADVPVTIRAVDGVTTLHLVDQETRRRPLVVDLADPIDLVETLVLTFDRFCITGWSFRDWLDVLVGERACFHVLECSVADMGALVAGGNTLLFVNVSGDGTLLDWWDISRAYAARMTGEARLFSHGLVADGPRWVRVLAVLDVLET